MIFNAAEASTTVVQFSLDVPGKRNTRVIRLHACPRGFLSNASEDYASITCTTSSRLRRYLHVFRDVPVLWDAGFFAGSARKTQSAAEESDCPQAAGKTPFLAGEHARLEVRKCQPFAKKHEWPEVRKFRPFAEERYGADVGTVRPFAEEHQRPEEGKIRSFSEERQWSEVGQIRPFAEERYGADVGTFWPFEEHQRPAETKIRSFSEECQWPEIGQIRRVAEEHDSQETAESFTVARESGNEKVGADNHRAERCLGKRQRHHVDDGDPYDDVDKRRPEHAPLLPILNRHSAMDVSGRETITHGERLQRADPVSLSGSDVLLRVTCRVEADKSISEMFEPQDWSEKNLIRTVNELKPQDRSEKNFRSVNDFSDAFQVSQGNSNINVSSSSGGREVGAKKEDFNAGPNIAEAVGECDAEDVREWTSSTSGRIRRPTLESGDFVAILSHPRGWEKCFSVGPAALHDPMSIAAQSKPCADHVHRKVLQEYDVDGDEILTRRPVVDLASDYYSVEVRTETPTTRAAVNLALPDYEDRASSQKCDVDGDGIPTTLDLVNDRFRTCKNRVYHTHTTFGCSGAPVLLFKRSLWPLRLPVVDCSQHSGTCFFKDGASLGFATCFTPPDGQLRGDFQQSFSVDRRKEQAFDNAERKLLGSSGRGVAAESLRVAGGEAGCCNNVDPIVAGVERRVLPRRESGSPEQRHPPPVSAVSRSGWCLGVLRPMPDAHNGWERLAGNVFRSTEENLPRSGKNEACPSNCASDEEPVLQRSAQGKSSTPETAFVTAGTIFSENGVEINVPGVELDVPDLRSSFTAEDRPAEHDEGLFGTQASDCTSPQWAGQSKYVANNSICTSPQRAGQSKYVANNSNNKADVCALEGGVTDSELLHATLRQSIDSPPHNKRCQEAHVHLLRAAQVQTWGNGWQSPRTTRLDPSRMKYVQIPNEAACNLGRTSPSQEDPLGKISTSPDTLERKRSSMKNKTSVLDRHPPSFAKTTPRETSKISVGSKLETSRPSYAGSCDVTPKHGTTRQRVFSEHRSRDIERYRNSSVAPRLRCSEHYRNSFSEPRLRDAEHFRSSSSEPRSRDSAYSRICSSEPRPSPDCRHSRSSLSQSRAMRKSGSDFFQTLEKNSVQDRFPAEAVKQSEAARNPSNALIVEAAAVIGDNICKSTCDSGFTQKPVVLSGYDLAGQKRTNETPAETCATGSESSRYVLQPSTKPRALVDVSTAFVPHWKIRQDQQLLALASRHRLRKISAGRKRLRTVSAVNEVDWPMLRADSKKKTLVGDWTAAVGKTSDGEGRAGRCSKRVPGAAREEGGHRWKVRKSKPLPLSPLKKHPSSGSSEGNALFRAADEKEVVRIAACKKARRDLIKAIARVEKKEAAEQSKPLSSVQVGALDASVQNLSSEGIRSPALDLVGGFKPSFSPDTVLRPKPPSEEAGLLFLHAADDFAQYSVDPFAADNPHQSKPPPEEAPPVTDILGLARHFVDSEPSELVLQQREACREGDPGQHSFLAVPGDRYIAVEVRASPSSLPSPPLERSLSSYSEQQRQAPPTHAGFSIMHVYLPEAVQISNEDQEGEYPEYPESFSSEGVVPGSSASSGGTEEDDTESSEALAVQVAEAVVGDGDGDGDRSEASSDQDGLRESMYEMAEMYGNLDLQVEDDCTPPVRATPSQPRALPTPRNTTHGVHRMKASANRRERGCSEHGDRVAACADLTNPGTGSSWERVGRDPRSVLGLQELVEHFANEDAPVVDSAEGEARGERDFHRIAKYCSEIKSQLLCEWNGGAEQLLIYEHPSWELRRCLPYRVYRPSDTSGKRPAGLPRVASNVVSGSSEVRGRIHTRFHQAHSNGSRCAASAASVQGVGRHGTGRAREDIEHTGGFHSRVPAGPHRSCTRESDELSKFSVCCHGDTEVSFFTLQGDDTRFAEASLSVVSNPDAFLTESVYTESPPRVQAAGGILQDQNSRQRNVEMSAAYATRECPLSAAFYEEKPNHPQNCHVQSSNEAGQHFAHNMALQHANDGTRKPQLRGSTFVWNEDENEDQLTRNSPSLMNSIWTPGKVTGRSWPADSGVVHKTLDGDCPQHRNPNICVESLPASSLRSMCTKMISTDGNISTLSSSNEELPSNLPQNPRSWPAAGWSCKYDDIGSVPRFTDGSTNSLQTWSVEGVTDAPDAALRLSHQQGPVYEEASKPVPLQGLLYESWPSAGRDSWQPDVFKHDERPGPVHQTQHVITEALEPDGYESAPALSPVHHAWRSQTKASQRGASASESVPRRADAAVWHQDWSFAERTHELDGCNPAWRRTNTKPRHHHWPAKENYVYVNHTLAGRADRGTALNPASRDTGTGLQNQRWHFEELRDRAPAHVARHTPHRHWSTQPGGTNTFGACAARANSEDPHQSWPQGLSTEAAAAETMKMSGPTLRFASTEDTHQNWPPRVAAAAETMKMPGPTPRFASTEDPHQNWPPRVLTAEPLETMKMSGPSRRLTSTEDPHQNWPPRLAAAADTMKMPGPTPRFSSTDPHQNRPPRVPTAAAETMKMPRPTLTHAITEDPHLNWPPRLAAPLETMKMPGPTPRFASTEDPHQNWPPRVLTAEPLETMKVSGPSQRLTSMEDPHQNWPPRVPTTAAALETVKMSGPTSRFASTEDPHENWPPRLSAAAAETMKMSGPTPRLSSTKCPHQNWPPRVSATATALETVKMSGPTMSLASTENPYQNRPPRVLTAAPLETMNMPGPTQRLTCTETSNETWPPKPVDWEMRKPSAGGFSLQRAQTGFTHFQRMQAKRGRPILGCDPFNCVVTHPALQQFHAIANNGGEDRTARGFHPAQPASPAYESSRFITHCQHESASLDSSLGAALLADSSRDDSSSHSSPECEGRPGTSRSALSPAFERVFNTTSEDETDASAAPDLQHASLGDEFYRLPDVASISSSSSSFSFHVSVQSLPEESESRLYDLKSVVGMVLEMGVVSPPDVRGSGLPASHDISQITRAELLAAGRRLLQSSYLDDDQFSEPDYIDMTGPPRERSLSPACRRVSHPGPGVTETCHANPVTSGDVTTPGCASTVPVLRSHGQKFVRVSRPLRQAIRDSWEVYGPDSNHKVSYRRWISTDIFSRSPPLVSSSDAAGVFRNACPPVVRRGDHSGVLEGGGTRRTNHLNCLCACSSSFSPSPPHSPSLSAPLCPHDDISDVFWFPHQDIFGQDLRNDDSSSHRPYCRGTARAVFIDSFWTRFTPRDSFHIPLYQSGTPQRVSETSFQEPASQTRCGQPTSFSATAACEAGRHFSPLLLQRAPAAPESRSTQLVQVVSGSVSDLRPVGVGDTWDSSSQNAQDVCSEPADSRSPPDSHCAWRREKACTATFDVVDTAIVTTVWDLGIVRVFHSGDPSSHIGATATEVPPKPSQRLPGVLPENPISEGLSRLLPEKSCFERLSRMLPEKPSSEGLLGVLPEKPISAGLSRMLPEKSNTEGLSLLLPEGLSCMIPKDSSPSSVTEPRVLSVINPASDETSTRGLFIKNEKKRRSQSGRYSSRRKRGRPRGRRDPSQDFATERSKRPQEVKANPLESNEAGTTTMSAASRDKEDGLPGRRHGRQIGADPGSKRSGRGACYVTTPADIRARLGKVAKWITGQVFGCPHVHMLTPKDADTFGIQQNLQLTMQIMALNG